jgi:peptidoglycan-associated lipoprotein
MTKYARSFAVTAAMIAVSCLGACSKKVAKVVTPPPPPPAAPTATLAANPSVIEQGQSTELTWKTSNAETVSIAGIGDVTGSGSQTIAPAASTTYTLTAKGPGGTEDASARVTVNPAAATTSAVSSMSEADLFKNNVKDVYFDFNQSSLRTDQGASADADAAFLKQHPDLKVLIEGHCDDRGSEEYNLALGDSRANSVRQSLLAQGVSPSQLKTVSYGKEHPFCSDDNETCWQQNRRDHFALQQ